MCSQAFSKLRERIRRENQRENSRRMWPYALELEEGPRAEEYGHLESLEKARGRILPRRFRKESSPAQSCFQPSETQVRLLTSRTAR